MYWHLNFKTIYNWKKTREILDKDKEWFQNILGHDIYIQNFESY